MYIYIHKYIINISTGMNEYTYNKAMKVICINTEALIAVLVMYLLVLFLCYPMLLVFLCTQTAPNLLTSI